MTTAFPTTFAEWMKLADARAKGDDAAAFHEAVDKALALDPRSVRALMLKADYYMAAGDKRAAASFYMAAARIPPTVAGPDVQAEQQRAVSMLERHARDLEEHVRSSLAQHGVSPGNVHPRFFRSLEILVGKKRSYPQAPKYFFYPELAPVQFFERKAFPFLDAVETAFADIRAELAAVDQSAGVFEPYVKSDPHRPPSNQLGLADNPSWSAYFLMKDGARTPGADRCPKTMASLAGAPLTEIPNRAPGVLFSRLTPGARIPPHNGMINARLICHLPLLVPGNCLFRVGNETRAWAEGKAWVFDDTIEHEAWNGSDRDRTILIFDIWRPDIGADERRAIVALCSALDEFTGRREWDQA